METAKLVAGPIEGYYLHRFCWPTPIVRYVKLFIRIASFFQLFSYANNYVIMVTQCVKLFIRIAAFLTAFQLFSYANNYVIIVT